MGSDNRTFDSVAEELTESDVAATETTCAGKGRRIRRLARLFFRPERFFAMDARSASATAVALCAYVFGVAWSLTNKMPLDKRAALPVPEDGQAAYVLGAAMAEAIWLGAIWYFLAGTWYGVRLALCSPRDMNWRFARRTFIFSELIYALPSVIAVFIWWITQDLWWLKATVAIIAVTMFWSVYVSYRGVRTMFMAARIRTIILFVLLPSLTYTLVLAAPSILKHMRSQMALASVPFESSMFTMDRPLNWEPMESSDSTVALFHLPNQGSFAVTIKEPPFASIDLEQFAQAVVQGISESADSTAEELGSFSTWGAYTGHGLHVRMEIEGQDAVARVFCASLPDSRILVTTEVCTALAESDIESQFKIVRNTLRAKPVR